MNDVRVRWADLFPVFTNFSRASEHRHAPHHSDRSFFSILTFFVAAVTMKFSSFFLSASLLASNASALSFYNNLQGVPDRAYQRGSSQKGKRVQYGDPDGPILLPHKSAQWLNEGGPEGKTPSWARGHGVAAKPIRQQRNEVPPQPIDNRGQHQGSYSRSDYEIIRPNRSSQWLQTLPNPSQENANWSNLASQWDGMNTSARQSPVAPSVQSEPQAPPAGGAWSSLADEWSNMNNANN